MAEIIFSGNDSPHVRQIIAFTVKSEGHAVTEAVDGQEGLGNAKIKTVDVALTDQDMPPMDGLTLIKTLCSMQTYHGALS